MSKRLLIALLGGLVALQSARLCADVKLPAIISNNMVLQANKPLPIWGTADAGEKVTVTFHEQSQAAVADADGNWRVTLNPVVPGGDAEKMSIAGKNTITIDNVLIGSVWICSGQSNMEFSMSSAHNASVEIPKANYPKIRLFTVSRKSSVQPLSDCKGAWLECSPTDLGGFTAVGYFFGRDIHEASGEPVGLIHTSWGGTPAQAWTSLTGLQKDKELDHYVQEVQTRRAQATDEAIAKYQKDEAEYKVQLSKWTEEVGKPYQIALMKWGEDSKKAATSTQPAQAKPQPSRPKPIEPRNPDGGPNGSTELFNGMINPLIPFAIEGAIWYQGESNADQWMEYRTLFPRMISDWREKWGQGDFPFYYVQLANFMARHPDPGDSRWAGLREAQLKTLSLPNTGMAVIIDIGLANNIHPTDKMDVGHRLAVWAEKFVFNKDVVYSGPLYKEMKIDGNKVRLSFTNVGSGLVIGAAPSTKLGVPVSQPDDKLEGFAVCGSDKKWVWADAQIDGDSVVLTSDLQNPIAVRYAWADNPQCNLYNKEGLPASPFRTDDFPQK